MKGWVTALLVGCAACGSFGAGSTSGGSSSGDPPTDAAIPDGTTATPDGAIPQGGDAGTDGQSPSPAVDGGVVVLFDGGFEEEGTCSAWSTASPGTRSAILSVKHGGARSCQVCPNSSGVDRYSLVSPVFDERPAPGDAFTATVWARYTESGRDVKARLALRIGTGDANGVVLEEKGSSVDLNSLEWARLTATLTLDANATVLPNYVFDAAVEFDKLTTTPLSCVTIDDVVIERRR